jgi:hypothetical protein
LRRRTRRESQFGVSSGRECGVRDGEDFIDYDPLVSILSVSATVTIKKSSNGRRRYTRVWVGFTHNCSALTGASWNCLCQIFHR